MIIGTYRYTPTTALGTASDTTQYLKGQLMGITVTATTPAATFNFSITDSQGDYIFYETGVTGSLVDNSPILLPYDTYIWTISSSSTNEPYVVKLKILEGTYQ